MKCQIYMAWWCIYGALFEHNQQILKHYSKALLIGNFKSIIGTSSLTAAISSDAYDPQYSHMILSCHVAMVTWYDIYIQI